MIGTIDIKCNAAKPNFPLSPFYSFINSPSQVRVVNVPRSIGDWEITKVYITANYPDNQSVSVECTLTGGCWHATLSASTSTGTSTNGFTITADGVKEDGTTAVTGYVLGKGDLFILDTDGTITVGSTTYYVHLVDTTPTSPKKGDLCLIDNVYKIYNGTAWVGFGGGDISRSDFADVSTIADRYTIADVKGKVNEVLNILKGMTAVVTMMLMPSAFAELSVQTAQLDSLYNDSLVVTNVSGATTDPGVVSNIVEAYGYATTNYVNDAIASATPGDYANVSNRAYSAYNTLTAKSGVWDAKQDAIADYTATNAVKDIIATQIPDYTTTNAVRDIASSASITNGGAKAYADANFVSSSTLKTYAPLTKDVYQNYTALTIGTRNGDYRTVGSRSYAQGNQCIAQGNYSFAAGDQAKAYGQYSHAEGAQTSVTGNYTYAWSGNQNGYRPRGTGTFNINPIGGVSGFFIGYTDIGTHMTNVVSSIVSPTAPVTETAITYQANHSAVTVSVAANGTLTADVTNWVVGQTQTALITLASGASVANSIVLVGYTSWITDQQFIAECIYINNKVYVNPVASVQ